MVRLGGLIGAILGFVVSVVFTEIVFVNSQEWTIAANAGLTALGGLAGAALVRRFGQRAEGLSSTRQPG
jgi:hypothetical protein